MRLPRWLLIVFIAASALALLAVPTWIWVTGPERTARALLSALNDGDIDGFNDLVVDYALVLEPKGPTYIDDETINIGHASLRPQPRNLADYRMGVQRLRLVYGNSNTDVGVTFIAGHNGVTTDAHIFMERIANLKARSSANASVGNQ